MLPDIPNVHTLTIRGPALCCPLEPYGCLLPLLACFPNLRALNLLIHGPADPVPADVDPHAMIPCLDQLESLILGDFPLVLVHALLRKTGSRLKRLIIGGRPMHARSAQAQVESDLQSQRSYASSPASSTKIDAAERAAHRRDLAGVLIDLQLQPCATRVKEFWAVPSLRPWLSAHVTRIGRTARFLPSFSLFGRIARLVLDRWIFSAMMSQDVALPRHLRALVVLLSRWRVGNAAADVLGEHCVSVDQAFAILGAQITAGQTPYLREVGLAYARYGESRDIIEQHAMRGHWAEFKSTCAKLRLKLWLAAVDEPWT